MRDITVKYTLRDEEEERLKQITEEYKKQHNFEMTEDKMFDAIMCLGNGAYGMKDVLANM